MRRASLFALLVLCLVATRAQDDAGDEAGQEEEPAAAPSPPPAKALSKLSLDSAAVKHLAAGGKEISSKSGKPGDTLLSGIVLEPQQTLEVRLTPKLGGSEAKVQQAMVMLAAADGSAAYVVAKAAKGGRELTASITVAAIEKQIGKQGGELAAVLLVGDPGAAAGLEWALGSVDLGEGEPGAAPKSLTARRQAMSNARPAIAHTFRPPAKRPPPVVSLAFSGLALAPLLLSLVLLSSLGANLQGMPSGAGSLWVLLFHGGLAAMLGLYLLFWTTLNLAQTLPLAALMGVFLVGSGYRALGAVADVRLAAAGGGDKAGASALAKKTN